VNHEVGVQSLYKTGVIAALFGCETKYPVSIWRIAVVDSSSIN